MWENHFFCSKQNLSGKLEEKENELNSEKKNALKRDKTIQGLTQVLREKEKEVRVILLSDFMQGIMRIIIHVYDINRVSIFEQFGIYLHQPAYGSLYITQIAELCHEIEDRDDALAKAREAAHKAQLQKYQVGSASSNDYDYVNVNSNSSCSLWLPVCS